MKAKKIQSVRLSRHVSPQRYQIMLKPDLTNFVFEGEETIFFKLTKATKQITLHAKDIKIGSAEIVGAWAGKISYKVKAETATLSFPKTIRPGKHKLKLSFTGRLNDQLRGLYRSQYQHKGETKHLAVSQFEATDARRAFPCFDEPAHKAIFDVTVMIPQHLTAVSNTIETDIQHHDNGLKVVKFAPTPKMSTYLLAFIIGEMEFIEGKTKNGVLVRVFTTPGKKHQAKFALQVAIDTLEFFNKYFDIPYPLPVLDMLAIPDFAAGAMENWGAVTYRETALLVDEQHTPLVNKQYVAHVIAHELTHQWFGNLVTMEWWTHLWLNEGFATYMSYAALDKLFPQWHMWTQFIFQDFGHALRADALKTTHPIEVEVHHPSQIDEIFDAVSYNKGASVIRMLADYLGEKDFRDGLRYYLKKHSYKNTSTVHLWEAFEKISGKPVRHIMNRWTKQDGFPVVSIKSTGHSLRLEQRRFFSSAVTKASTNDRTLWPIPVKLALASGKSVYSMLQSKHTLVPLKRSADHVKLNSEEVGFYISHYEPEMLEALHAPLNTLALKQDDRMGIIRDAFALTQAGEMSVIEALKLAEQYSNELSYNVWVEILSGFGEVDDLLAGSSAQSLFNRFVLESMRKIKHKVNWQPRANESNNITLLRGLILKALGEYGDKATIARAQKIFRKAKKPQDIHPDIRSVVYYLAARNGNLKDHKRIAELYKNTDVHEEKNRLGRALVMFKQPQLLKRSLNFVFSKHVRLQDAPFVYIFGWNNQQAWPLLWNFVQGNWSMLLERYGQGGRMLSYMIKPLSSYADPKAALSIQKFLKTHQIPSTRMATVQTLEKLQGHLAWRKRDRKPLEKFLQRRYNNRK